jgi:CheY-like chemotaxis protein
MLREIQVNPGSRTLRKRVLYVVSRERPKQYAELRRAFAGTDNIEVVLDRRRRQRRYQYDPPPEERRRYTRRWRDLSHVLHRIGWAVVYQPLAAPAGAPSVLATAWEVPEEVSPSVDDSLLARPRRVLVVDDDPSVRSFLRDGLEFEGYEVLEAADGRTGERLYRERPADVAILDIFLPEQNGLTTMLRLRADFPNAAIIVISGGGGFERRLDYLTEAQALGATRTIRKPFGLSDILRAVNEVLPTEDARRRRAQPF